MKGDYIQQKFVKAYNESESDAERALSLVELFHDRMILTPTSFGDAQEMALVHLRGYIRSCKDVLKENHETIEKGTGKGTDLLLDQLYLSLGILKEMERL